jgi:hypothetical protein
MDGNPCWWNYIFCTMIPQLLHLRKSPDWPNLLSGSPGPAPAWGSFFHGLIHKHPAFCGINEKVDPVEPDDAIVMGHRGETLLQRWLLSSVAKRVLSCAQCTVIIVR